MFILLEEVQHFLEDSYNSKAMESYPTWGNAKAKKICMCRAAHLNNNKIVLKVDLPHHHSIGFQYTHYKNSCKCKIIAFQEKKTWISKKRSFHLDMAFWEESKVERANRHATCIRVVSSLPQVNDVIITPNVLVDNRKQIVLGHIHEAHFVSLQPMQGTAQKSLFVNLLQWMLTGKEYP